MVSRCPWQASCLGGHVGGRVDLAAPRAVQGHRPVAPAVLFPCRPLRGRLGAWWGRPSRQPAMTGAEPPPAPLTRALSAGLSLCRTVEKAASAPPSAFVWARAAGRRSQGRTKAARSQPPGRMERFSVWIIRPQKACGPVASIRRTRPPTPAPAPAPPGPFRALPGENSHRPQGRELALGKQRLWPLTPQPQPELRPGHARPSQPPGPT